MTAGMEIAKSEPLVQDGLWYTSVIYFCILNNICIPGETPFSHIE